MVTLSNKIQRFVIKMTRVQKVLKRRQKEIASKSINKAILVVSVFPLAGGGR